MAEFKDAKISTVKMKIPLNSNGNIAQIGDTTASVKYYSIAGISATANLEECRTVFNIFYGDSLAGGWPDEYTAQKTIIQTV